MRPIEYIPAEDTEITPQMKPIEYLPEWPVKFTP